MHYGKKTSRRRQSDSLVTEFSKKTGDYASLSANDIKILALTYQLEVEHDDVEHIRTEPPLKNLLIQMGLHVLSVDGMLIRHTRNYILRCHGCFKTTSDMTTSFCPHCGNMTLKMVAVSVNEDGSLQMHFSQNPKVLNARGMRYSLPAPQGGKHASNPHLVLDQNFPQQRLSRKARAKMDVFDPDYIAGASAFAENDIYSRAANLNIRDGAIGAGRRRVNPNAPWKKCVKKR